MEPYSQTYQEVRLLFRKAAERAGAAIREYPVAKGRTDHELVIDVASLGHPEPVWSLVVSSGLHGIEGFFGSAIQTAYLRTISGPELTDSRGQLVFIHALNPFGFAMLRRFNEDNVDLNRNFLLSGEKYLGSSKQYAQLDHFLNPPYPPRSGDFYLAKALWNIIRFRYRALKQAVAEGQFEYPKGLFFGGDKPSESTKIFQNEIIKRIRGRCIVHLDFHSGLGKSASYKLLVPKQRRHDLPRYSAIFGPGNVEVIGGRKGVAYDVKGDLGGYATTIQGADYHFLFAEFGTYSGLRVLGALRAENQAHFFTPEGSIARQHAKARLFDSFCPASPKWRMRVLEQGIELVRKSERFASGLA